MKKQVKGVSSRALDIFIKYSWPGNVRELENILEYAFIHCKENIIDAQHLPPTIKVLNEVTIDATTPQSTSSSNQDHSKTVDSNMLLKALEDCRWNKIETAKRINVSRTTLWRMMKKYGLLNQL